LTALTPPSPPLTISATTMAMTTTPSRVASPEGTSCSAKSATSAAAEIETAIDLFGGNLLNQLKGSRVSGTGINNNDDDDDDDDDDAFGASAMDSDEDDSDGDSDRDNRDGKVESTAAAGDWEDGRSRKIEIESIMDRNADFLAKAFHEGNNTLDVAEKVAAEKRHEGYVRLFLHADRVYSSPLTRALQTAFLSMEGHRAVTSHGFVLYSVIREVRRLGGLDTMGIEVGEGVERRVRAELSAILGARRADELLSCPLDVNDSDQMWWTPMSSHDTERDQQDRIVEFLTFSRYCESKIPVFVGHSLFFRAFYSKRVSKRLLINRGQLSENLKRFRLSNASMLAVTVAYKDNKDGSSEAVMLDADLIFGGGFHGPSSSSSTAAMAMAMGSSPTVFSNLGIPSGLAANIQSELRNKKVQLSNGVRKFYDTLFEK
jgi:hypothetical protein